MRIAERLFFSSECLFSELDFKNRRNTINAFKQRISEYYLQPAKKLEGETEAFAQGLICVAVIDILARYCSHPAQGKSVEVTSEDYIMWMCKYIPGFTKELAKRFYKDFRCGLVHEGRIKRLGQFTRDYEEIVKRFPDEEHPVIVVNPNFLLGSIEEAFKQFCKTLRTKEKNYQNLISHLEQDFKEEFVALKY